MAMSYSQCYFRSLLLSCFRAILTGKAGPLLIAAVVLQLIFIMLLFRFWQGLDEAVILHNGSRIKFNEL